MGRIWPSQAARSQALPMPREMACCGEGPEAPTGFQQDSGPKHLISPSVVGHHLDPASAWERNLGLGGAEGGGKEGRDFTVTMEEGKKNTAYKSKTEQREKRLRMSFKSISCGRERAETAKGIL